MPPTTACRITICPLEATNNYEELTRFEVDAATTTLRDVAERIRADPRLFCTSARVGLTLASYEDDATGDTIDFSDPTIALKPLSELGHLLMPRLAASGGGQGQTATLFVEGQELWLVVGGRTSAAAAIDAAGKALLEAQFDFGEFSNETVALRAYNATLEAEVAAMKSEIAAMAARNTALEAKAAADAAALRSLLAEVGHERLHQIRLSDEKECKVLLAQSKADNPNKALAAACRMGKTGAAVRLVQHYRADVKHSDADFWLSHSTPLHFAVMNGHLETARALVVGVGADVHAKNANGWAPLHYAAINGFTDLCRLLVKEFGADVTAEGSDGGTPLHLAAMEGKADTARALVRELGAATDARGGRGKTPLHLAAANGHIGTAFVLVEELGADVDAEDDEGKMPIDCCPTRQCRAALEEFV